MSIRPIRLTLLVCSGLFLAGCLDPPEARFVYREETGNLTTKVRKAVEEQIEQSFGTPHDLVAWLKLPLDYGGIKGTVAAGDSVLAPPINKFPIEFDEENLEKLKAAYADDKGAINFPPGGLRLDWISGEATGSSIVVTGYQAEQGLATTAEPFTEKLPAEGTELILTAGTNLQAGRKLYMVHCMHCHGVSGDGNGPTARYLNPLPRDYRLGEFKFKSTLTPERISSDDLARVIKYGIPGTYMPSFLLLKESESHALVEYVRWLAMRGEIEYKVGNDLAIDFSNKAIRERGAGGESAEEIGASIDSAVNDLVELYDTMGADVAELWANAETEDALVNPPIPRIPDSKESRERGRMFFLQKCTNCHGNTGLGNGQMTIDFQKNDATGQLYENPGLHNIWGHKVQPRNLKQGQYRGGRRPIDLYRRIYAGISPSKMPNFATSPPETIWDAVNYVLHVPFESPGEYAEIDAKYEEMKKAGLIQEDGAAGSATPGNE
ncbi:MAG TPA: c-type cytochrome [Planctomycetaceae bacterium]|nr:c-type cytochrome [Planctomycetaceae bacterium]